MRGNTEGIFQPKLLGFVAELLQVVYEAELHAEEQQADCARPAVPWKQ